MAFNLGLKALRSLCHSQNVLQYHRAKLSPLLFKSDELPMYTWVDNHVKQFHALPQMQTLEAAWPEVKNIDTPEPCKYYVQLLENQFYYTTINRANIESQEVLKNDKDAHGQAVTVLQQALDMIVLQKYRQRILDVPKEAQALLVKDYHLVLSTEDIAEFGWPYMDIGGPVMPGDIVSFIGRPATGKAQPLTSKVLTPTGMVAMGSLVVGQELASVDGQPSHVTAIYPQGKRRVFVLSFQDGRTCEASDEHLWEVWYREWKEPKILTTLQLIAKLKHQRYQRRLSIRLFSGEYGQPVQEPFSPYLLGVFLGDGCMRGHGIKLSSADPEILAAVGKELRFHGLDLLYQSNYDWGVRDDRHTHNRLAEWFTKLGVMGKKAEFKFIPEQYMLADRGTRLALLKGLMDTDGTAEKTGAMSFSSSSPVLARQVQQLVRSLGGKATVKSKTTTHLPHYRVHIVMENRSEAFSLKRKLQRVLHSRTTHTNHRLTLESVTEIEAQECQCLSVSHKDELYVTDDFVVTHNTWKVLYSAIHNWRAGRNTLIVSMEMSPLPIAQRIGSMYAHTNIQQLKTGAYSTQTYQKFIQGLQQLSSEKAKLYVVDGNLAASVEDVFTLAHQLKCKIVYIDGAYLMRHKNVKLDRYTRAAENVELMKRYCTDLESTCFSSWQFNREAVKGKKKGESGTLEDIGYTDAIGQVSSIVLGLFQEEGVETMKQRLVRVLKGRNGEVGQFSILWDFTNMVFDQVPEPKKEDSDGEHGYEQLKYL